MLNFRLQLLADSGQIGPETVSCVQRLIRYLETKTGIVLCEENAAMLVTHFAIALERASRNEPVGPMEEATRGQVQASPHYPRGVLLLDEWLPSETLPCLPENERDFLLLHLCVLLEKNPGQ